MENPRLVPGFPTPGSFFVALASALLLFVTLPVSLACLSGCGSGGQEGNLPAPDLPAGPILCPCTADVFLDEWKPQENLNYETRLLVATNTNIHHGISRTLLKFDVPADLDASRIQKATLYFSGCSHCNSGGYGGLVGFYSLTLPFSEEVSTWYSLDGMDEGYDDSVHTEGTLLDGKTWNEAVNGQPPADAQGLDLTELLQKRLDNVRGHGILMRYMDEHQQPPVHQNVASRESDDPRDFPPFIRIDLEEDPLQVIRKGEEFNSFQAPARVVASGPYSLKVTSSSAIVAWEEESGAGELRHVEMPVSSLAPATEYQYRVNEGTGRTGRFRTSPKPDPDHPGSFSFFVFGDSRSHPELLTELTGKMIHLDPTASFALHTGDFVNNGNLLEDWAAQWWAPMTDMMLHLPIYPTMGNHEVDSPWYHRYYSSLGGTGTNYSFDFGNLHFVVLDGNSVHFGGAEQMNWLTQDLEGHTDSDFTALSLHIPPFASSPSGSTGARYLQEALVPLCEAYGVDLVFSGDVHSFQHHLRNRIHYFISAGAGEAPSDPGLPLPGMTLGLARDYHYLHGRVEGHTLRLTAYDLQGNVLDDTSLTSGVFPAVVASVQVEADRTVVAPAGSFHVDFYLQNVETLDRVDLQMDYFKDEPPARLQLMDAEPSTPGIQMSPGDLGGTVTLNQATENPGRLQYREESIGGLSSEKVKVGSATFQVPEGTGVTAFHLVPSLTCSDPAGNEIPHFMGGVSIAVQPNV